MPSLFTLSGSDEPKRGLADDTKCVCKENPRTKRGVQLCFIGKGALTRNGKVSRSGWIIKGSCPVKTK